MVREDERRSSCGGGGVKGGVRVLEREKEEGLTRARMRPTFQEALEREGEATSKSETFIRGQSEAKQYNVGCLRAR